MACLACALLFVFIRSNLADSPSAPVVPPFEQIQEITISASKGWILIARPDGSGKLAFGSGPLDVAKIPIGSLDVRKFYNAVVPTLQSNAPGTKSSSIALRKVGEVSVNALYTNNETAVSEILTTARTHAQAVNKSRFDQLLRQTPLLPEEP